MSSCSLNKVKDPFGCSPMDLIRLIHVSLSHTYCIINIGLVYVIYNKHPINFLYSVLFTIGEESTSSSFTPERKGVLLGLQSFILNLLRKSKACLDWCTLIPDLVWTISSPKNWLKSPKAVMDKAWFKASFKEKIYFMGLPIIKRSSTYKKIIIFEPWISFKYKFVLYLHL